MTVFDAGEKEPFDIIISVFNINGKIITEKRISTKTNKVVSEDTYTYLPNGLYTIKNVSFNSENDSSILLYDVNRELISSSALKPIITIKTNNFGKITEKLKTYKIGKTEKTINTYDSSNNIIETKIYSDSVLFYNIKYTYNDKNQAIKVIRFGISGDGNVHNEDFRTLLYNSFGLIETCEIREKLDGDVKLVYKYTYNN